MKYLRKIFEEGRNPMYGLNPSEEHKREIQKLLDVIDHYHDFLKKDKIWQDYYKEFENWRKNSDDKRGKEFLEEVIKFAEKRFEELKIEFQNHIEFVKDLYLSYLEDCESFSEYSIKRKSDNKSFFIELSLGFSSEVIKNRKMGNPSDIHFSITGSEILDYWKPIYDFFVVLESNGYKPRITFYQNNASEIRIMIET